MFWTVLWLVKDDPCVCFDASSIVSNVPLGVGEIFYKYVTQKPECYCAPVTGMLVLYEILCSI